MDQQQGSGNAGCPPPSTPPTFLKHELLAYHRGGGRNRAGLMEGQLVLKRCIACGNLIERIKLSFKKQGALCGEALFWCCKHIALHTDMDRDDRKALHKVIGQSTRSGTLGVTWTAKQASRSHHEPFWVFLGEVNGQRGRQEKEK